MIIRSINLQQSRKQYAVGKRPSLQQMVLGKLDSNMQKKGIGPLSHSIHKNKLKMVKRLKREPETLKILEENSGFNFSDIDHSKMFLDRSPEAREIKTKIKRQDYITIKIFCTVKEIINKTKRQPMEWEIFANDISDKGLVSK